MDDENQVEGECGDACDVGDEDIKSRVLFEGYVDGGAHLEVETPGVDLHLDLDAEFIEGLVKPGGGLEAASRVFAMLGPIVLQTLGSSYDGADLMSHRDIGGVDPSAFGQRAYGGSPSVPVSDLTDLGDFARRAAAAQALDELAGVDDEDVENP